MTTEQQAPPTDEYDEVLLANARPPDWITPEPAERYNLVVIGGGTAGLAATTRAAALGAKVALVEGHMLGGASLTSGYVPLMCVARAARAAGEAARAQAFGVRVPEGVTVDFAAVMEHARRVRGAISGHMSARRLRGMGVDVFFAHGRFKGRNSLDAGGRTLRFVKAVMATGSRAARLDIDGLEAVGYVTMEGLFMLGRLPGRLAVIGGGPHGCGAAQALARLGSAVELIQEGDELLGGEDPDAARVLEGALVRDGVTVRVGARVLGVSLSGDAKALRVAVGGREEKVEVDEILVVAGRVPNVEDLGLDAAGVAVEPGAGVKVDDRLRTTNPAIFAAGNVRLKEAYASAAEASARVAVHNALLAGRRRWSDEVLSRCIGTDPEVAHIGMYERDALAAGILVDEVRQPLSGIERAVIDGDEDGFVKILVERGTQRVVGATIVAAHAGEMIGCVAAVISGGLGLEALEGLALPRGTEAEAARLAAETYRHAKTAPAARKMLRWLMALER